MNTDIPPPSDADKAIDLAVTYERCLDKSGVKPAIIRRCYAAEQKIEVLVSHNVAVIKERDAALSELSAVLLELDAAKYLVSCRRAAELLAELKQGPRPNGEEGDV